MENLLEDAAVYLINKGYNTTAAELSVLSRMLDIKHNTPNIVVLKPVSEKPTLNSRNLYNDKDIREFVGGALYIQEVSSIGDVLAYSPDAGLMFDIDKSDIDRIFKFKK